MAKKKLQRESMLQRIKQEAHSEHLQHKRVMKHSLSRMMSVADICILMMPDILGLGSEGRINTPSTLGGNWQWRIGVGCVNDWLADIVYENTALYGRLSETAKAQKAKDEE